MHYALLLPLLLLFLLFLFGKEEQRIYKQFFSKKKPKEQRLEYKWIFIWVFVLWEIIFVNVNKKKSYVSFSIFNSILCIKKFITSKYFGLLKKNYFKQPLKFFFFS